MVDNKRQWRAKQIEGDDLRRQYKTVTSRWCQRQVSIQLDSWSRWVHQAEPGRWMPNGILRRTSRLDNAIQINHLPFMLVVQHSEIARRSDLIALAGQYRQNEISNKQVVLQQSCKSERNPQLEVNSNACCISKHSPWIDGSISNSTTFPFTTREFEYEFMDGPTRNKSNIIYISEDRMWWTHVTSSRPNVKHHYASLPTCQGPHLAWPYTLMRS